MRPTTDVGLELMIVIPYGSEQQLGTGEKNDENKGITRFQARLSAEGNSVKIHGDIDAEVLFEGLNAILGLPTDGYRLQLNFTGAKVVDSLAIDAIIAALRAKGSRHKVITLEGLPVWAYIELDLMGADEILGHQWVSNNSKKTVSYYRQD